VPIRIRSKKGVAGLRRSERELRRGKEISKGTHTTSEELWEGGLEKFVGVKGEKLEEPTLYGAQKFPDVRRKPRLRGNDDVGGAKMRGSTERRVLRNFISWSTHIHLLTRRM